MFFSEQGIQDLATSLTKNHGVEGALNSAYRKKAVYSGEGWEESTYYLMWVMVISELKDRRCF